VSERSLAARDEGLIDLLDRLLGTGVVAAGDVTLSVAGIDLVYLNLRALLASVETAWPGPPIRSKRAAPAGPGATASGGEVARSQAMRGASRRTQRKIEDPSGFERGLAVLERFATGGDGPSPRRRIVDADPEDVQRGLAKLVLTLVDVLRRLMERQAIRRIEGGSLEDHDVERMGRTFLLLEERMEELKATFGLHDDDLGLGLDLGVQDLG